MHDVVAVRVESADELRRALEDEMAQPRHEVPAAVLMLGPLLGARRRREASPAHGF